MKTTIRQIVGQTSVSLVTLTCGSWSEGLHDLYFTVQWFCLVSWRLRNYESVWPNIWPQNKCRSLWPLFHCSVILPCILKTIQWLNIVLWDYEPVWPDVWQNISKSLTYFIVHWICLISWRLFDVWTLYFVIMSLCNAAFALKQPIFHGQSDRLKPRL